MPAEHLRLEPFGPLVLAGLVRRHPIGTDDEALSSAVAKQWRALLIDACRFPALFPPRGYGVGFNFEPHGKILEFFCGFMLRSLDRAPIGLHCVEIPEITCAVFAHSGPIARLRHTLDAIFATALPLEGLERQGGETPSFILRARPSFNPLTGFGGVEVLVPVKARLGYFDRSTRLASSTSLAIWALRASTLGNLASGRR